MATSGEYTWNPSSYGPGVGYPNRAKITWSATWNQSTLQWTVTWNATAQGATNATRWTTIFGSNNNCNSYVTITDENGNVLQTKSLVAKIEPARNNDVILEGTFTVGVTNSGTRSLVFSGQIYFETTGSAGISSGSQTFALDTVAMASSISSVTQNVSVGSSGGSVTTAISPKNSSYTHKVKYTFGSNNSGWRNVAASASPSDSYTIPASWLSYISNATSGTATVEVATYNGSTQIGSTVSATFTITANVTPSIGSVSVAPRGAAYNAGITSIYIAGYSTALVSASSVAGANGSTITKYEFIKDGTVVATYNSSAASYSYTSGVLSGSSATFSVRVTDSRGKTYTKAASAITIQAYATPAITASAYRSNSSGTATSDGTYLKITASATATPSANSITDLKYSTKASTSSTWSSEANIPSSVVSGFYNTTSYDVRIRATDKLGNSSYKYFTIPTAEYTVDFKVGGKGVAFGKVAETDNLVDSAWAIKSSAAGTAYLAEHGLANNAAEIKIRRSDTNRSIALQVGSGGVNRGLYINDGNANQWLLYYDDSQVYINKPLNPSCFAVSLNTTLPNIILLKRLNIININIRGASINSSGSIGTIPSDYRPANYFYFAGMYQSGNTTYPAQILIDSIGDTQVKYFNGSNYVTATSGSVIANLTYFGVY